MAGRENISGTAANEAAQPGEESFFPGDRVFIRHNGKMVKLMLKDILYYSGIVFYQTVIESYFFLFEMEIILLRNRAQNIRITTLRRVCGEKIKKSKLALAAQKRQSFTGQTAGSNSKIFSPSHEQGFISVSGSSQNDW